MVKWKGKIFHSRERERGQERLQQSNLSSLDLCNKKHTKHNTLPFKFCHNHNNLSISSSSFFLRVTEIFLSFFLRMHTMSQLRAASAPELMPSSSSSIAQPGEENVGLEGVATNVKLLLKLIQDHNVGSSKDNLERKTHRVAGMISIIDEVKNRIQKIQTTSKRRAELRRCNTDVKPNIPSPRDKKSPELITDEKERLRRELHSSLIARQSIQAICSSLGKEKQIMAAELARKAQELSELEDYIIDLKDQNHMLMEKLRSCSLEQHKERGSEMERQGNVAMQERNKELSEQLLKVNDGFQHLKKKLQETQEENTQILATMEEMEVEVQAGINNVHDFKEKLATNGEDDLNIREDISALEHMLESLSLKISKRRQK